MTRGSRDLRESRDPFSENFEKTLSAPFPTGCSWHIPLSQTVLYNELGPFQAILGNLLGPFSGDVRQVPASSGNLRQFQAITGNFMRVWGAKTQEKTAKAESLSQA